MMIQNPVVDTDHMLIEIRVVGNDVELLVSDRGSEANVWLSVTQAKQIRDALNEALKELGHG